LAENVVGVKLDRLAPRIRLDRRDERRQPLLVEDARRVIEQQRIDVGRSRQLVGLVGVIGVGMDGREREHDRARDLGAELLGDLCEPMHLVDVEEDVVDPEATAAMPIELTHPGVHQGVRSDAERH
jgi:hypothetical protein